MLHHRLQEMEIELAAIEQCKKLSDKLAPECIGILDYIEQEMEVRLGAKVPPDWKGWLSYRRHENQAMVVLRGRAFKEGGLFGVTRAGFDLPQGHDAISDFQRGFDVSPPQDIDHLLINFGLDNERFRVFLWYGENIAPYKLIYAADLDDEPHRELGEAVVEACTWILKRPKQQTLEAFLSRHSYGDNANSHARSDH